jgi:hypothetical protein
MIALNKKNNKEASWTTFWLTFNKKLNASKIFYGFPKIKPYSLVLDSIFLSERINTNYSRLLSIAFYAST